METAVQIQEDAQPSEGDERSVSGEEFQNIVSSKAADFLERDVTLKRQVSTLIVLIQDHIEQAEIGADLYCHEDYTL